MSAKKMTAKEYAERCERGEFIFPAKYLSSTAERINWRDKVTRASMTAPILRHTVLTQGGEARFVSVRVDEGSFDETTYVQTDFKQGDRVYIAFRSCSMERGVCTVSGAEIFSATDSAKGAVQS